MWHDKTCFLISEKNTWKLLYIAPKKYVKFSSKVLQEHIILLILKKPTKLQQFRIFQTFSSKLKEYPEMCFNPHRNVFCYNGVVNENTIIYIYSQCVIFCENKSVDI